MVVEEGGEVDMVKKKMENKNLKYNKTIQITKTSTQLYFLYLSES
jgi:hypothetical protein